MSAYAAAAGLDGPALGAIKLAVSEAVTNTVVHAYRSEPGTVHVAAAVAGPELWVLVADHGCGFETPSAHPGLGFGLALIADASEDFMIHERAGGGTEVRMRFPLPAKRPAEPTAATGSPRRSISRCRRAERRTPR